MSTNYNADSIKILKGLEPVRKRPGMYIGSTDEKGLHHLIWEIFDNCIDEVLAGYGNEIIVTLKKDNSIIVTDYGRGIPIGINKESKISSVETVFTNLHAGGKFDNDAYKVSGGLHGVGASVVNALSKWLNVIVNREGKIYEAKFINGGQIEQKLTKIGETSKTGTIIHFKPDDTIFTTTTFISSIIEERLQESSFLFSNLKIIFNNEITGKSYEFKSKNGIKDFILFLNPNKPLLTPIIYYKSSELNIEVEVAFAYTNDLEPTIVSFANSIKTFEGGSHESGFRIGFSDVINNFARKWKILKQKDKNLDWSDVKEGLSVVISVKIPENIISYEAQTKNKLFTIEARTAVKKVTEEKLEFWFNENKNQAVEIIKKAIIARDAKLAAKRMRETFKKTKIHKIDRIISEKLTPAQSKIPAERELFLVEGDSAGGSAKLGRNKKYQAILPLKGKVINVLKASIHDVLKNEEVNTIIHCLGTGILKEFDLKKLKYHKIIIMTDADTDGAHIQILLLTLFYRYMSELIINGNIYIAQPPLYKLANKKTKEIKYAFNEVDFEILKKTMGNCEIQRYKGLGEMNAIQLWDTTMDPKERLLIKVTLKDFVKAEKEIYTLMGDDAKLRKEWISTHISFTENEEFNE